MFGSNQKDQWVPITVNSTRGVPEEKFSAFTQKTFICDGGKSINGSAVNDGYCDCLDGSDEPGTSACLKSTFFCVNKGYRPMTVPSSRVDDSVCDCCDGSDENVITYCPDTCNEFADKEKAKLKKIENDFKIGANIRKGLIERTRTEKSEEIFKLPTLKKEQEQIQNELDDLKSKLQSIENLLNDRLDETANIAFDKARKLLGLDGLKTDDKVDLLVSLFDLLHIEKRKAEEMLRNRGHHISRNKKFPSVNPPPTPELEPETEHALDDEMGMGDYDDYGYKDHYMDGHDPGFVNDDAEGGSDVDTFARTEEVKEKTDDCPVVEFLKDERLHGFCEIEKADEEALHLVLDLLKDRKCFNEITLVLGHFLVGKSFSGSYEFALNHLSSDQVDTCPTEFENIPSHCALKEDLSKLFVEVDKAEEDNKNDKEVVTLRAAVDSLKTKLREVEDSLKKLEDSKKDFDQYQNQLEYLALKGQCFDVSDGKFTYSMCMLDKVTQKENTGGMNVVSLGKYETVETFENVKPTEDEGFSAVIHFNKGQHCHAFGPRSADVSVRCAPENKLRAAREPSTCYYTLVFESPIGCSPEFAKSMGLNI